jgi:SAM-dependent methyltransferase
LLYRQSFERFATPGNIDGYDVATCSDCGAGFADNVPPQSAFDQYYRELSKYENVSACSTEPPRVERRLRDAADLIAKHIPSRESRVLEIGCATGQLLRALHDLGFRKLVGTDPSPACIRAVGEFYGMAGFAATIFTIPVPEEPYDFLVLTGVMEHIRDLDGAINQFQRLLSAGGRVYIEVPDASRYEADQDAPFQEFSVEHINFFSRKSLSNLMVVRGFRVVETDHTVRPLHEVTCPCVYGVFENSMHPAPIDFDNETELALEAYIKGCSAEDTRIRGLIKQSLRPGARMIVWGVGTHTLRLLATGGLDPATIALFVDSNPKYQQQRLRGIPIVSPAEVSVRSEPILISSCSSQAAIQRQIRNELGLKNPLILLYGPSSVTSLDLE